MCISHEGNGGVNQTIKQFNCNSDSDQGWLFKSSPTLAKVTIRGVVINAATGTPIYDLTKVKVVFSKGTEAYTATNLGGGLYTVVLPRSDVWTRTATYKGFIPSEVRMNITSNIDEYHIFNRVVLSPVYQGEWRFVLSFGTKPSDLDIHLLLPDNEELNLEHPRMQGNAVTLDTDSRNGYAVETITLNQAKAGWYKLFVVNASKDGMLGYSNAKIIVYRYNVVLKEIKIKPQNHSEEFIVWNVFRLNKGSGVIEDIDTITKEVEIR
jgi:hypothetical protein